MNVNTTVVAKVGERPNSLTELFQKETKERTEEAVAREARKRQREEKKGERKK